MPELPEVETVVRQLNQKLTGRSIRRVKLRRADVVHGHAVSLPKLLTGRHIDAVRRDGKRIVLELSGRDRDHLIVHLGMSGQLWLCSPGKPVDAHTHLRIELADGGELRFRDPRRFGGVWVLTARPGRWKGKPLKPLGPDPLQLTPAEFLGLLGRSRQIKALLLDQQRLAGLGNIYCDESLHRAGIHPLRRAETLSAPEARRLLRAIKDVLKAAIRRGGSSINDYRDAAGRNGTFQRFHRVYGRAGRKCPTCRRAIILRRIIAGRSTHYCPRCQPLPCRSR